MIKLALAKSVSKQYLSLQKTMRRNKKLMSSCKLVAVLVIFFGVLAIYAANITQASTKWYFHRQETKKNDALTFDLSIVDLDVLKLEKKLLNNLSSSDWRWYGSTTRMEIITAYPSELALNE